MNREIKFRAWDPAGKAMYLPEYCDKEDFFIDADGGIRYCYETGKYEAYTNFSTRKDWIVMQYTGLRDKNGKEIYEGDICHILYTDWPSNTNPDILLEDYLISISEVGRIVYEAPSFYIELKDRYGDMTPMSLNYGTHGRIQVIGNIYD